MQFLTVDNGSRPDQFANRQSVQQTGGVTARSVTPSTQCAFHTMRTSLPSYQAQRRASRPARGGQASQPHEQMEPYAQSHSPGQQWTRQPASRPAGQPAFFPQDTRQRRRLYRCKDTRSHFQREAEAIQRKKELDLRREDEQYEREMDELRECTFQPALVARRRPGTASGGRAGCGRRARSAQPRGTVKVLGENSAMRRLQQLVERQLAAADALQELAEEEEEVYEKLHVLHAELHDRILQEETKRVVDMLQQADSEEAAQREMVQRVRRVIAAGGNPEHAQKVIVDELTARSQEEVHRRVQEAFDPICREAEGELHGRRLALTHELEAVEAKVTALRGGALCEEARDLGFEFGYAEQARASLVSLPTPLRARRCTPPAAAMAPLSNASDYPCSSPPSAQASPQLASHRAVAPLPHSHEWSVPSKAEKYFAAAELSREREMRSSRPSLQSEVSSQGRERKHAGMQQEVALASGNEVTPPPRLRGVRSPPHAQHTLPEGLPRGGPTAADEVPAAFPY